MIPGHRSGQWGRAALAILACLLACAAEAEEVKHSPRDAAEVVRQGDVLQWLKHYERERRGVTGNRRENWSQHGQPAPKDEQASECTAVERKP